MQACLRSPAGRLAAGSPTATRARPPAPVRPALPPRHAKAAGRRRTPPTVVAAVDPASALITMADVTSAATDAAVKAVDAVTGAVSAAAPAAVDTAVQAAGAATPAASSGGWLAPFASAFEAFLKLLDSGLEAAHVPYSYGFAIIALTVLVKVATYPLTRKQMASTIALQALQPRVKEIQERYKGRPPEEAQVEVARLYKEAGVNPLAGCLPTLVTLPVWIGLYRALSNVADEGLLKEGWFWIPSLAGPTSLAAQKAGSGTSWLFPFVDGAPPIGWPAAGAYLVLPVALIASQYITQKMMSPQTDDPAAQQSQAILKFLPLMIGWFSLNVPAGLTLYWFTNNLLSTAQQAYLKKTLGAPAVAGAAGGGSSASTAGGQRGPMVRAEVVDDGPARPTGKELNARRSAKQVESRGEKFRALKAKEAAKKAAAQAASQQAGGAAAATAAETASAPKAAAVATDPERPVVPDAPPPKNNSSGTGGSA